MSKVTFAYNCRIENNYRTINGHMHCVNYKSITFLFRVYLNQSVAMTVRIMSIAMQMHLKMVYEQNETLFQTVMNHG